MSKKRTSKELQIGYIKDTKKNLKLTIYEELEAGLNPSQISRKYGWSESRISNYTKSLKEENLIVKRGYGTWEVVNSKYAKKNFNKGVPLSAQLQKKWRVHNIHYIIKPYQFSPKYSQIIGHTVDWREWKVKFHKERIEIQLRSKEDFSDVDKYKAIREADDSFERTLFQLQNQYGFQAWKEGKANIKLVNQHIARTPSGIADTREGKEQLRIRKREDGKTFFLTDKSKTAEHEYTHPKDNFDDSEKVEPYLNDFLENQPPTNSQIMNIINQQTTIITESIKINKETASGLNAVVTFLKSQLPTGSDIKPSDKTSNKKPDPNTYIG